MANYNGDLQLCSKGHRYYKSSDCPTCPVCEEERKPTKGLLSILSAPARRALESKGIDSAEKLSSYTEREILSLHGIGPSSMPKLKAILKKQKLQFKKN